MVVGQWTQRSRTQSWPANMVTNCPQQHQTISRMACKEPVGSNQHSRDLSRSLCKGIFPQQQQISRQQGQQPPQRCLPLMPARGQTFHSPKMQMPWLQAASRPCQSLIN